MVSTMCHHVPLLHRRCYVACMVAMDQLRTPYSITVYRTGMKKDSRRTSLHTFAINKRQPIRSDMVVAQCVHSGDVRQWRYSVVLSWWKGLGADLVFVVNIQKT